MFAVLLYTMSAGRYLKLVYLSGVIITLQKSITPAKITLRKIGLRSKYKKESRVRGIMSEFN